MKKMSNTHNFTIIVFGFLFFSVVHANYISELQDHADQSLSHVWYQNYNQQVQQLQAANPLIFQFLKANLMLINRKQWTDFLYKLTECQTEQDRMQVRQLMRQAVVQQAQPNDVRACAAKIDEICNSQQWQQEVQKLPLPEVCDVVMRHKKEFKEFVKPMLPDTKA